MANRAALARKLLQLLQRGETGLALIFARQWARTLTPRPRRELPEQLPLPFSSLDYPLREESLR